jgi:hypothetical protein
MPTSCFLPHCITAYDEDELQFGVVPCSVFECQ